MRLDQIYDGSDVTLLIVPEHTTTKRGWLAKFKSKAPSKLNDSIFKVITKNSDILEQVRKINSHYKNVVFVNHPLQNSELKYSEVLREIKNKQIFPFGTHLFRYQEPLHIFDSELGRWKYKKELYLSCCHK